VYSAFCLVSGIAIQPYGEGKYLHIMYPFSAHPFLNVDNNLPYILFAFLWPLLLYGIFFWLSARVFRVFFQPKLFTKENISELKRFYLLNIFIPFPAAMLAIFFVPVETVIWGLIVVHLFLGIFAFFLAGIFAQGVNLQNEQDLFI
jgi:hypothetical protein